MGMKTLNCLCSSIFYFAEITEISVKLGNNLMETWLMPERGLKAVLPSLIFHNRFWIPRPAILPLLSSWLKNRQILISLMGFSCLICLTGVYIFFLFSCCWVVFLFYFGCCWTEMCWPLIRLWQFGAAEADEPCAVFRRLMELCTAGLWYVADETLM